ncbi:MAG: NADH-quinone oxidoreductase subunit NuoK [Thermoplasmata archaeon]|nr:NADH-quinone oxidoreductase subunit NuoK [Thermoplasmata archaeon]
MTDLPLAGFVAVSAVLLGIGLFGILTRRNFILLLIAIEVAMNSAILNFVVFGSYWNSISASSVEGQSVAVVLIGLAATEVAVGLAIVLALNRSRGSINVAEATTLRL